jgi:hypothetical protein
MRGATLVVLMLNTLMASLPPMGCAGRMPAERITEEELQPGDLVFLDLDCGELCDAIEEVTEDQFGVLGPSLSHVGLVEEKRAGKILILEAWPADAAGKGGIRRTTLGEFLSRGRPWLGRMPASRRALAMTAAKAAGALVGTPYDDEFLFDNGKLYCSELVYLAYRQANGGKEVFVPSPMRFGVLGSKARLTWQRYFNALGREVPEGKAGVSPLGLYLQIHRNRFSQGSGQTH